MPVVRHELEVMLVSASLAVEHDDRVAVEIRAFPDVVGVVGGGIAAGHVQESALRVQRKRSPSSGAADRYSRNILPGRTVKRARALGSSDRIVFGPRYEIELPDDFARLAVERIHAPLHALLVAAGIADEYEALPGDRRRRHHLVLLRIADRRLPEPLTGLKVVGEYAAVLRAAIEPAIHVGRAAIRRQKVTGILFMRAPILGAGRRIQRKDIEFGRADQRALDHEQAGLEGRESLGVVGAQHLEVADVLGIDLTKVREALRSQRLVVARPVSCRGRGRDRHGWRRRGSEGRILFPRERAFRRVQRERDVAKLGPGYFSPGRMRKIVADPNADRGRDQPKNDVFARAPHFSLLPVASWRARSCEKQFAALLNSPNGSENPPSTDASVPDEGLNRRSDLSPTLEPPFPGRHFDTLMTAVGPACRPTRRKHLVIAPAPGDCACSVLSNGARVY